MSKVQYAESLVPLSMAMFILQIRWEEQDEGEKKQKKNRLDGHMTRSAKTVYNSVSAAS